MDNDLRTLRLHVRLTPAERAQLRSQALQAGLSISDFVRETALSGSAGARLTADERRQIEQLLGAHADLRRLGGLFKHAISQDKGNPYELSQILRQIRITTDLLSKLLDGLLKHGN